MAPRLSGAEFMVNALDQYGVEYIFGNPGTTELPFIEAIGDSDLAYRLGLHEDIAVGMAAGYAVTKRYHAQSGSAELPLGVVNLHVAPGLAHGLANLNEAHAACIPLLVTAGVQSTSYQPQEPILLGDLVEMADPFTKMSIEVPSVEALPMLLRRAISVALTPPHGPVFLGLPLDVMLAETKLSIERIGAIPTAGSGSDAGIETATTELVAAKEPVLVIGDGIARSGPDAVTAAVELAEASGSRVLGEILAGEIGFPTDHEQWVSFLPPLESIATDLLDTDTLVLAGCSTMTTPTQPEGPILPTGATIIEIGVDPWELGKNTPVDCSLIGDPGRILARIATEVAADISEQERSRRLEQVTAVRQSTRDKLNRIGTGEPSDPHASKAELVEAVHQATPTARVVDESVTSQLVFLNQTPLDWSDFHSGKAGGLGYGLPAAIGAAIAEDSRDTLALIGDGAYLYYPHTIYSAARYGIDITVVVADNRNYRILKDNTLALMGGEEEEYHFPGMEFDPPVNIALNAESNGAEAERLETSAPDSLGAEIRQGIATAGPVVLVVPVQD